ncbi:WbqC family protein [Erythrobacter rubeus]|uniref:WbqC family protein n=1 Tax=Erythrobacter rubeus TaxID=2760803 RepID=A0ABR8KSR8_9SPHN|nr:WbqC family protein [Erythrobacter rubeus]MBD2842452.1 WbqC family protein [Erythrobacter rubeus]
MISAIMQPTFLPWIGYFDLIDTADTFVFLDDAQVLKRSWGVRNRITGQNGETFLTVPLTGHSQNEQSTFVGTAIAADPKWSKTHLATIRHAYSKAPYFAEVHANLEALMSAGHATIGALNIDFITDTARLMGINTPFVHSSELAGIDGRKDDRLLSICRTIRSNTYVAAQGSAAYIERDLESGAFAGTDVDLRYHNFAHPIYQQLSDEFVSHMSVVDLLMNCGYSKALEIIRSGRRPLLTSADMRKDMA